MEIRLRLKKSIISTSLLFNDGLKRFMVSYIKMKYCGINQVRESVESADVKNIIVFTIK